MDWSEVAKWGLQAIGPIAEAISSGSRNKQARLQAEQAEATAGINAGVDDAGILPGDTGEPGGAGFVGTEPEIAGPDAPPASPDAGAPATSPTGPEDGDLLASPPAGKREDSKGRTTTAKSHGWYEPRGLKAGGDRRKSSGPRKKNLTRAASPETGTSRKLYPGYDSLTGLARGTSIYEQEETNYKTEEIKILKEQKELDILFNSLKARDEKNETETQ